MSFSLLRLYENTDVTLSNSDRTITMGAGVTGASRVVALASPTSDMVTGLWYWETVIGTITTPSGYGVGIAEVGDTAIANLGFATNSIGLFADGAAYRNSGSVAGGFGLTAGDVIGHLLDLDTGTYYVRKDDVLVATFTGLTTGITYSPAIGSPTPSEDFTIATRYADFTYAIPAGYEAASTANNTFSLATANRALVYDYKTITETFNDLSYTGVFASSFAWANTGKWYWETIQDVSTGDAGTGIGSPLLGPVGFFGGDTDSWAVYQNNTYHNGGISVSGLGYANNDVVRHYLDLDAGTYGVAKNGGTIQSVTTALVSGTTYGPGFGVRDSATATLNLYESDFAYAVPAGFSAMGSADGYALDPSNIISNGGTLVISNNDRTVLNSVSPAYDTIFGTPDTIRNTGVWRWEFEHTNGPAEISEDIGYGGGRVGLTTLQYLGHSAVTQAFAIYENGTIYYNGGSTTGTALADGDVISYVIDLDTPTTVGVELFINGVSRLAWSVTRAVSGEAYLPGITQRATIETPVTRFRKAQQTQTGVGGKAFDGGDDIVAAIAGEGYTTNTSIDAHPDWTTGTAITSVAVALLPNGPVPEKWFQGAGGANNDSKLQSTAFAFPALAGASTQNEFEVSAAFKSDSLINSQTLFTLHHGSGINTWTSARRHADNTWDIYQDIPGGSNSVILASGLDGGVAAADVFYMTLRLKGATSTLTDGVIELWINGALIYQNNAVDFRDDERLEGNISAEVFAWQAFAKAKNITVNSQWTSADSVAPTPVIVTDGGSFTETITPTTFEYYTADPVLLAAIAGEFYTDEASIDANAVFNSTNMESSAATYLPVGPVGERWFNGVTTGGATLNATVPTVDAQANNKRDLEGHFAVRVVGVTTSNGIVATIAGSGTFSKVELSVNESASTFNLTVQTIGGGSATESLLALPMAFAIDTNYYVVIRIRSIDITGADDASDGAIEVWINNELQYQNLTAQWGTGGNGGRAYFSNTGTNIFQVQQYNGAAVVHKNVQFYDKWLTADSVNPPIRLVTDDGLLATTSDTTIDYYTTVSIPVIFALGGDGYTDRNSIIAHPDWDAAVGQVTRADLESYLTVPEVGERWFTASAIGGSTLTSASAPLPNLELEFGFAFHTAPLLETRSLFTTVLTGGTGGGSFGAFGFGLSDDGTSGPGFGPGASFTDTGTGFIYEEDTTYYIKARIRRQSAENVADGVVEIWINNILVVNIVDLDMGIGLDATWTSFFGRPNPQTDQWIKNITYHDAWTSADGVAPAVLKVTDTGSFTEFVEETTLDYYVEPELLGAISGEGYTDNTSINAHPQWETSGAGISSIAQTYLAGAPAGERWFEAAASNYLSFITGEPPLRNEVSYGLRTHTLPASQQLFTRIQNYQGGSNFTFLEMYVDGANNNELLLWKNGSVPLTNELVSNFEFEDDTTYYVTTRVQYDTSGDGWIQVWINEALVFEIQNQTFNASGKAASLTSSHIRPTASSSTSFVNVTVYNEWQAADAVVSPTLKVTDDGSFEETVSVVPIAYYATVETVTVQITEVSTSESISPPHYDDGATDQADPVVKVASVSTSESISPPHYDETFTNQTAGVVRLSDIQTSESIEVQPAFYNIVIIVNTTYLTSPIIGVI